MKESDVSDNKIKASPKWLSPPNAHLDK